ncbi:hypothetical protein G5716_29750 [Bacillus pacificus]|nr:hypothetical protein [Bacillus pacificus]
MVYWQLEVYYWGNETAFAEKQYLYLQEGFTETNINLIEGISNIKDYDPKVVYELNIPAGFPYYLPTKFNESGINLYKYKVMTNNPQGDWNLNDSNGEIICGTEGIFIVEVYNEQKSLIRTYNITFG